MEIYLIVITFADCLQAVLYLLFIRFALRYQLDNYLKATIFLIGIATLLSIYPNIAFFWHIDQLTES